MLEAAAGAYFTGSAASGLDYRFKGSFFSGLGCSFEGVCCWTADLMLCWCFRSYSTFASSSAFFFLRISTSFRVLLLLVFYVVVGPASFPRFSCGAAWGLFFSSRSLLICAVRYSTSRFPSEILRLAISRSFCNFFYLSMARAWLILKLCSIFCSSSVMCLLVLMRLSFYASLVFKLS